MVVKSGFYSKATIKTIVKMPTTLQPQTDAFSVHREGDQPKKHQPKSEG
jgi:hypothetical protein